MKKKNNLGHTGRDFNPLPIKPKHNQNTQGCLFQVLGHGNLSLKPKTNVIVMKEVTDQSQLSILISARKSTKRNLIDQSSLL